MDERLAEVVQLECEATLVRVVQVPRHGELATGRHVGDGRAVGLGELPTARGGEGWRGVPASRVASLRVATCPAETRVDEFGRPKISEQVTCSYVGLYFGRLAPRQRARERTTVRYKHKGGAGQGALVRSLDRGWGLAAKVRRTNVVQEVCKKHSSHSGCPGMAGLCCKMACAAKRPGPPKQKMRRQITE